MNAVPRDVLVSVSRLLSLSESAALRSVSHNLRKVLSWEKILGNASQSNEWRVFETNSPQWRRCQGIYRIAVCKGNIIVWFGDEGGCGFCNWSDLFEASGQLHRFGNRYVARLNRLSSSKRAGGCMSPTVMVGSPRGYFGKRNDRYFASSNRPCSMEVAFDFSGDTVTVTSCKVNNSGSRNEQVPLYAPQDRLLLVEPLMTRESLVPCHFPAAHNWKYWALFKKHFTA